MSTIRLVSGVILLTTLGLSTGPSTQTQARAKNVVLFIADAGGLPTLNAASIYGHGAPQKLFINTMPHIALADTSSASRWVTDSAAGMTAIVTGRRTHNGVVGQSDTAVRKVTDGEPLKTILEYAEEQGLSTGVVSNSSVLSATPAACYAHVNDRANNPEIFQQLIKPRFGNGVDVVIGAGLRNVTEAAKAKGLIAKDALKAAGLEMFDSLEAVSSEARRAVVLFDGSFDLDAAVQRAIEVLSRNPKGYFLMVESDTHTETVLRGLDNVLQIDKAIRRTVERAGGDTLVLFTADHSYDFRIRGGRRDEPLVPPTTPKDFGKDTESVTLPALRRDDGHTGEEVLVAAQGPGAERVRGFLSNTDLFSIMMKAFGWNDATVTAAPSR
jgi:alkaline phosphatase